MPHLHFSDLIFFLKVSMLVFTLYIDMRIAAVIIAATSHILPVSAHFLCT